MYVITYYKNEVYDEPTRGFLSEFDKIHTKDESS